MAANSGENFSLQELESLPIPDRVLILLDSYKDHDLEPVAFLPEIGEIPIEKPEDFPKSPAYISVKAIMHEGVQSEKVILTEPRIFEPNMIRRLQRSIMVRNALLTPADPSTIPSFLNTLRFSKVFYKRTDTHSTGEKFVKSTLERYIDSRPVGSVHLAHPDVLTEDFLRRMIQFPAYFQDATQQFADNPYFYHRFISNPGVNHGEGVEKNDMNKWWLDYDGYNGQGGRRDEFTGIFGRQFVIDQGILLNSSETAKLLNDWVCVDGNLIPAILGIDEKGDIVVRIPERTARTQFKYFDEATFLATLMSNPVAATEYMNLFFEAHPTREAYEYLRRAIIFDKAGNILGLGNAIKAAREQSDLEQALYLEVGRNNLISFVAAALYKQNYWDPKNYKLS